MDSKEFDELVQQRIKKILSTLVSKADEYANDIDRLHNFNKAAGMSNQTREKALRGFLLKHIVSVDDIIDSIEQDVLPKRETIDEKIGDIINYYILLEACIVERIEKREESGRSEKGSNNTVLKEQ